MPDLEKTVIDDLSGRLISHLKTRGNYGEPHFLSAGGSAAVYRVEGPEGTRAFKAFNPRLFEGPGAEADKRRLDVQRRFIGHACPSLVQTYQVDEAEGTAFMEMEFVAWPQLTKQLPVVPDDSIVPLITQLVRAVRFLDTKGVVHRDIKPENIHVSPDFKQLKLLDLGVARAIEALDGEVAGETDHSGLRPFLATAQYSSPEYLFRLDEPSSKLWQGLNFYQIGAVLHDLIMKIPLFHTEMGLGNRWLVARAVLTKTPSFADGLTGRLPNLKALAARCLNKDLDTRLQLVGWDDFDLEGATDPLVALRGRLAKGHQNSSNHAKAAADGRLQFERTDYTKRLVDQIRTELIETCGTKLPLTVRPPTVGVSNDIRVDLAASNNMTIRCEINIDWLEDLYAHTARISMAAQLISLVLNTNLTPAAWVLVCTVTIREGEENAAYSAASAIAAAIGQALDLIDSTDNLDVLHGRDLQTKTDAEQESDKK